MKKMPTLANVEYDKIYLFNSKDFDLANLFKNYFANRGGREDAIEKHIQEIKAGIISDGGMDKIPPIVVDINTLTVADGNCRNRAVKEILEEGIMKDITLRVIFEDIPAEEFDERVIKFNMGQKSWGILDFIYNYAMRGSKSHQKFIDFCERNETLHSADGKKINPRYAAAALAISVNALKTPNLPLTDEDIENGNTVVYEANRVRVEFSPDIKANGGGWYEQYLRAWHCFRITDNQLEGIDFETYLKAVKTNLKNNKRYVKPPYGSNKKQDWNAFFRTIKTYM